MWKCFHRPGKVETKVWFYIGHDFFFFSKSVCHVNKSSGPALALGIFHFFTGPPWNRPFFLYTGKPGFQTSSCSIANSYMTINGDQFQGYWAPRWQVRWLHCGPGFYKMGRSQNKWLFFNVWVANTLKMMLFYDISDQTQWKRDSNVTSNVSAHH